MVGQAGLEPATFLTSRFYRPLPSPIWILTQIAVSRASLLRHITAKSYSTFISRSFSLKRLGENNRKLSLIYLLLRCFASVPLRDRVWLARWDLNHIFGCTSPRPKPLDDRRIYKMQLATFFSEQFWP